MWYELHVVIQRLLFVTLLFIFCMLYLCLNLWKENYRLHYEYFDILSDNYDFRMQGKQASIMPLMIDELYIEQHYTTGVFVYVRDRN